MRRVFSGRVACRCAAAVATRVDGKHSAPLIYTVTHRLSARCCSTVPTEDEVMKAYGVLGVHPSSSFVEVKKKYVSLAKEHHPDVAAAAPTTSSEKMVDINNAYNTVSRFHKAGHRLSSQVGGGFNASASSSASWRPGQQRQNYYTAQDRAYEPWHEDLDPLLYEMMWEEMRRQNDHDPFTSSVDADEFSDNVHGSSRAPPRWNGGHKQQRQSQTPTQEYAKKTPQKTTTWPESDVQAMVNMYQDGKSFEFIGNALGKEVAQVTAEFNRWSNDTRSNRRSPGASQQSGSQRRRRRNRNRPNGRSPQYHMEFPCGPPYGFYDFMVDEDDLDGYDDDEPDGNPFGYAVGEDYGFEYGYADPAFAAEGRGPVPYSGSHQMSGGPNASTAHSYRPSQNRHAYSDSGFRKRNNPNSSFRPKQQYGKNRRNSSQKP